MEGLDNLKKRLEFHGGCVQEERFIKDKLRSLKKALLYSYQAETAVLADGREFRCLINPNKLKADYDAKIISIPYEDICLGILRQEKNEETGEIKTVEEKFIPKGKTSKGLEKIDLKSGDVFLWKETGTYWIVYLQHIEENAYFRAEIYKCGTELEIFGKKYKCYIRGPVETTIQWNQKKGITWNDLNYSIVIYITKNEETLEFFHRFSKIKVDGKMYRVATVDTYSADNIIEIHLDEFFDNDLMDMQTKKEELPLVSEYKEEEIKPYIEGPLEVRPFDIVRYKIHNISGGQWIIDDGKKAIISAGGDGIIDVEIITGKAGNFNLTYKKNDIKIAMPIVIKTL